MSQLPDYYAILEVHPAASKEVIDAAYRKLAAKYHPDVNSSPDASGLMKQLNEAYTVLIDPVKRAAYDRHRKEQSASNSKRKIIIAIGVALVVVVIARMKVLGVILLALVLLIWLLVRTKR